jgi:hypothetical protein
MTIAQIPLFEKRIISKLSTRQINILQSPKNNGTAFADSKKYLRELDVEIENSHQPIQFLPNTKEQIHRWSPYVQGFSAKFVQKVFDKYKHQYRNPSYSTPFREVALYLFSQR